MVCVQRAYGVLNVQMQILHFLYSCRDFSVIHSCDDTTYEFTPLCTDYILLPQEVTIPVMQHMKTERGPKRNLQQVGAIDLLVSPFIKALHYVTTCTGEHPTSEDREKTNEKPTAGAWSK